MTFLRLAAASLASSLHGTSTTANIDELFVHWALNETCFNTRVLDASTVLSNLKCQLATRRRRLLEDQQ